MVIFETSQTIMRFPHIPVTVLLFATLLLAGCEKDEPTPQSGLPGENAPKESRCDLTSFRIESSLNGIPSTINFQIDHKALTATGALLKWISKEHPSVMTATFTTSGKTVTINETTQVSGKTTNRFAETLEYRITAEDGTSKTYTVRLVCPQINTELPVIRLLPDKPVTSKDYYVTAGLDMTEPLWNKVWWNSAEDPKIEVRLRGNSTLVPRKKSYRIKFPEKISPLGLDHAEDRNWTLLANDGDKTFMRNLVAFSASGILFNKKEGRHDPSAVLFTPCSQFVNVYLNDDYVGLYQMSDQMQRGEGRIEVEKLTATDTDPAMISGGYVLETGSDTNFFTALKDIAIHCKYPEEEDRSATQFNYIKNFMDDVETVLYGDDFKDTATGWRTCFDEVTAVDYLIITEFTGNPDGYYSIYAYKRRGVDKLFFGPVWDFDRAFDNDLRKPSPRASLMLDIGFNTPNARGGTHWFKRMWEDESFRKTVKDRWNSKKAELLAEALRVLDDEPGKMQYSIDANFTRWKITDQDVRNIKPGPKDYETGITYMKQYVNDRYAALDKLFNN